jgi:hypothetical protein
MVYRLWIFGGIQVLVVAKVLLHRQQLNHVITSEVNSIIQI